MSVKDERVFQARRAACRNALTDGGASHDQAEPWCDAWELEAALQGNGRSGEYWQDGKRWTDGAASREEEAAVMSGEAARGEPVDDRRRRLRGRMVRSFSQGRKVGPVR